MKTIAYFALGLFCIVGWFLVLTIGVQIIWG